LAFHAPFDQHMLGRALKEHLGHKLQQVFVDVADIAPLVCPQAQIREAGLDEWIDWFKLEVFERHNASADALATAELALILFSRARQQQIHSPLNLQQRLSQWKRRQQAPSF
jgi:DNA polymerase-3 subunit epsilon